MNLWDIGKHVDGVKVDQIWICEQVPGSFSGKVLHVALEGGILAARVSAVIRRCFADSGAERKDFMQHLSEH